MVIYWTNTYSVEAVLPVPGIPEMYSDELDPLFSMPSFMYCFIISYSFSLQGS
jgi:hypothetical protein